MATATTLQSTRPTANHRIFSILQGSIKISQDLREILESAAEAFNGKSYKTAAKYWHAALDSWTATDDKRQNQLVVLTKYMLCICWLESTDAKDLLDSLRTLKELEKSYGYEYPMLYYAIGKAYFKLYRFNDADEILKKGFSVLNGDMHANEFNIPATNIIIPESSREKLVAALVTLTEQCSSWHRPDAVCCMSDCSSHSHNEGIDKHIFFGSPTFNGMVQVSCNNPNVCIMKFHIACWKAKKEQLCSLGKMSDKEVLNCECFTPNCENEGVRSTIKKIEIYDENAESKAVIETRSEDAVWHAKPNVPSKGAIRKQQQQPPKVKVPSAECRSAPYERPVRPHSVPHNVPAHNNSLTHRVKIEENEEDDDIHDERALKVSIEKLQELRANNFGMNADSVWRPNLPMYGNEFLLATGELTPDPDFGDSGAEEADLKAFFFSYFYEFISANGPIKLGVLAEKWIDAKGIHFNSDAVLKHYLDISEFLLQSVKFAVVGDYICVPEKLPEAYELAKNDTCEILRFFMMNDIDQRSNSSSVDDDAAYDAIINPENNNNSLSYSSVLDGDKVIVQESGGFSNPPPDIHKKTPPTPKTPKAESSSKLNSDTQEKGIIAAPEITQKKPTPPSQIQAEKKVLIATPTRTTEKRANSPDCPASALADKESEPIVKKATENTAELFIEAININRKPQDKEQFVLPPLKTSFSLEKLAEPIEHKFNFTKEFKSTNDLQASVASLAGNHYELMNNSGEPDDGILAKTSFLPPRRRIETSSPSKAEYEKISDSHEILNNIWHNFNTELIESRGKALHLESELEYEKARHAAMRIRMLQKSLQNQHSYNQNKILMKMEECRKNIEVCASIQTILKNSAGLNMPKYETQWTKIMEELEKISNNHEKKFNEINEQLFSTKEPEKFEGVIMQLEPLPAMPTIKLTDVIQNAFDMYRLRLTTEYQQMFPRSPAPANRPFQPQLIGNSQHWQPNADLYTGSQLFMPPIDPVRLQNYLHSPPSMSQRNSASSVAPNLELLRSVPPPSPLNFPYFPYPAMPYPPVNPSVPPMQQISSVSIQQQAFNAPQQGTSEAQQQTSPFKRNFSPVHQIARPHLQSAPPSNFGASEHPKPNPLSQSPLLPSTSQIFPNLTQQNDNFLEKSGYSSMSFEELSVKFKNRSSDFELPTFSSANERPSTPLLKNSISSPKEGKHEPSMGTNSQRANSLPELLKIVEEQERAVRTAQKASSGQEKLDDSGGAKICLEKFEQLDLNKEDQSFVVPKSSGAKKKYQNSKSNNNHDNIDVSTTDNTSDYTPFAKSETVLKVNEKGNNAAVVEASNVASEEAKTRKKSEHSIDKLMKMLRKKYAGVLELDLLRGVEFVRKLHNNSLSGIPISQIICEVDKNILDRQQKQLCGYIKRIPATYFAASNTVERLPWTPIMEEERKRQSSVSSTSSACSLRKEPQNSLSVKKKWEPVVIPNDGWKKETPESDCTICLETILLTQSLTLQCQHTFHKKCIKNWYQHNQSCPTCRVHSTIDDEYPPLPLG